MSRAFVARALALIALVAVLVLRIDSRAEQPAKMANASVEPAAIAAPQSAVERALAGPADFEFKKTLLKDVAARIADRYKISVQLDMKGLPDANVTEDAPITDSIKDVSLRSALHFILGDNELGWFEDRGGVLVITTPDIAKQNVKTRAYGIGGLYESSDVLSAGPGSADELVGLVSSTIATTTWDSNGGVGSLTDLGGALVVSQTDEVQLQIAELVAALKSLHQKEREKAKGEPLPTAIVLGSSPRDAHIDQMLDSKMDFDFSNTTLADIAKSLEAKLGIPVRLDSKPLNDAGVTPDLKISSTLRNATARAGLHVLLGLRDLGFTIDHEVLLITTADVAHTKKVTEIYPVGDLVKVADSDSLDFDSVIEAITSTVSPASWDTGTGPGEISPFSGCEALVFTETEEVHQQVKELLQMVRAARKESSPTPTVAKDAPVIRFYSMATFGSGGPVDDNGGRQIIDMICKLIEPQSWSKPEAYIGLVPGAIVVRQTPDVHRRIERLLGPGGLGSIFRTAPTTGANAVNKRGGGFGGSSSKSGGNNVGGAF